LPIEFFFDIQETNHPGVGSSAFYTTLSFHGKVGTTSPLIPRSLPLIQPTMCFPETYPIRRYLLSCEQDSYLIRQCFRTKDVTPAYPCFEYRRCLLPAMRSFLLMSELAFLSRACPAATFEGSLLPALSLCLTFDRILSAVPL